jgi:hypothetical protein
MLHQPPEVRYLTIEIFDRWCSYINHIYVPHIIKSNHM